MTSSVPRLVFLPFAIAASLAGCIRDARPPTERGAAAIFDRATVVKAPTVDRCLQHKGSYREQLCADARYLAQLYFRKLSPGDPMCLENGVGEEPVAGCQARARVEDVATGQLLVSIQEAQPGTRWFDRAQHQIWFEEGALVDRALEERGY